MAFWGFKGKTNIMVDPKHLGVPVGPGKLRAPGPGQGGPGRAMWMLTALLAAMGAGHMGWYLWQRSDMIANYKAAVQAQQAEQERQRYAQSEAGASTAETVAASGSAAPGSATRTG